MTLKYTRWLPHISQFASWKNRLAFLLLILPLAAGAQQNIRNNYFQLQQNGATGDKNQDVTAIIQKGIDQVAKAGGGLVYFAPGQYATSTLILKDNITIYLEAGAQILASTNQEEYTREQVKHNLDTPKLTLFYAKNARNIRFSGLGTVNGQARHQWLAMKEVDSFIKTETENAQAAGVDLKRAYLVGPPVSLFYLQECENVHFEDITVLNSPNWGIHVQWSKDVFIRNIRVFSSLENGVNSDGIDIDGCKNVTISDCIIATGDDAICLKSTNKNSRFESVENVTVTNCVLTSSSGALKIGTETFGDFRHIVFNNCVIRDTNRGLGIFIRDGGTVDDVIFSNITMETKRKHYNWWGDGDAFRFVVLKRNDNSKVGVIKNILLQNIIGHCQGTSRAEGFAGQPLQNITLRNVQLFMHPETALDKRATSALRFNSIHHLKISNFEITWDTKNPEPKWQQSLQISEVQNLHINGFLARAGRVDQKIPVIELTDVQDAVLQDFQSTQNPTDLLLRILGGKTKNIQVKAADFTLPPTKVIQVGSNVPRKALLIQK